MRKFDVVQTQHSEADAGFQRSLKRAIQVNMAFLIAMRNNVQLLPELDDPGADAAVKQWVQLLLDTVYPDLQRALSKNLSSAQKTSIRYNTDASLARVKQALFSFLPNSFVLRLKSSHMVRRLYAGLMFRVTGSPKYKAAGVAPTPDALSAFLGASDEEIASAAKIVVSRLYGDGSEISDFKDSLGDARNAVVFVSHVFPTTWNGIAAMLNDAGATTAWLGSLDERLVGGYSTLETREIETQNKLIVSFPLVLAAIAELGDATVLINLEAYFHADWDGERAAVQYMFLSAILESVASFREGQGKVCSILYDAIKPINRLNGTGGTAEYFYKKFVQQSEMLVYNSNSSAFHDFLKSACPDVPEAAYLFRQPAAPDGPRTRRLSYRAPDEIHVACISVSLGEQPEPSRDAVPDAVRQLLGSGVHFHYYCDSNNPGVRQFIRSLPSESRSLLHLHPIVRDQRTLISQLEAYHLGFTPFDHGAFADGIAKLESRFYKDALNAFWQSTIATSFLVYAAAGLPILVPRGCQGVREFVDEDCIVRSSLSEIPHLTRTLERLDFDAVMARADDQRGGLFSSEHVRRFLELAQRQ